MAFDSREYRLAAQRARNEYAASLAQNTYQYQQGQQSGKRKLGDMRRDFSKGVPRVASAFTGRGLGGAGVQSGVMGRGLQEYAAQNYRDTFDMNKWLQDETNNYNMTASQMQQQLDDFLAQLEAESSYAQAMDPNVDYGGGGNGGGNGGGGGAGGGGGHGGNGGNGGGGHGGGHGGGPNPNPNVGGGGNGPIRGMQPNVGGNGGNGGNGPAGGIRLPGHNGGGNGNGGGKGPKGPGKGKDPYRIPGRGNGNGPVEPNGGRNTNMPQFKMNQAAGGRGPTGNSHGPAPYTPMLPGRTPGAGLQPYSPPRQTGGSQPAIRYPDLPGRTPGGGLMAAPPRTGGTRPPIGQPVSASKSYKMPQSTMQSVRNQTSSAAGAAKKAQVASAATALMRKTRGR